MQIQGFIGRWRRLFCTCLIWPLLRPKVLRRETGKVTQRLLLLVDSPQREACVKRISIRHASCAPPLSSLEILKTKHLQLVSWILFPQRARGDSYREITTALCDIHQQWYILKTIPGAFPFGEELAVHAAIYSKVLWLNGRKIELSWLTHEGFRLLWLESCSRFA